MRPFLLALLLVLCQSLIITPMDAGEATEASLISQAAKPGPDQGKALAQLGRQKPTDVAKVVAVLVDAVIGKDIGCQITAGQSLRSMAWGYQRDTIVADALNTHTERLMKAAKTQMTELTNAPLEAVSFATRPDDKLVPELMKLLAPGMKFRRYSVTALGKCRPLTPEIRRAVLAEVDGEPLVQQDVAFTLLRHWSSEELAGDDIDQALTHLLDAVMGNVVQLVRDIAKKRAQLCPRLMMRLRDSIDYLAAPDASYADALRAFSEFATPAENQTLAEHLLIQDPRTDPDRYQRSLLLLDDGRPVPAKVQAHFQQLVDDQALDLYLRRAVAMILARGKSADEQPPTVKALSQHLFWTQDVHGAIYHGDDRTTVDERLVKASSAQERAVWTLVKPLAPVVKAHAGDKDFNQRGGAWAHAFLVSWAKEHPAQAWEPYVVYLTLRAFLQNYAQSEEEKTQMLAYLAAVLKQGLFSAPSLRTAEFPQGGAGELRVTFHEALDKALRTATKTKESGGREFQSTGFGKPLRWLRDAKAPDLLLLYSQRQLVATLRVAVRERTTDQAALRQQLTDCGFSLVPIDVAMEDAARPLGQKR